MGSFAGMKNPTLFPLSRWGEIRPPCVDLGRKWSKTHSETASFRSGGNRVCCIFQNFRHEIQTFSARVSGTRDPCLTFRRGARQNCVIFVVKLPLFAFSPRFHIFKHVPGCFRSQVWQCTTLSPGTLATCNF